MQVQRCRGAEAQRGGCLEEVLRFSRGDCAGDCAGADADAELVCRAGAELVESREQVQGRCRASADEWVQRCRCGGAEGLRG